jgi:hypothetical protein
MDWGSFSKNTNPMAVDFVTAYPDLCDWEAFALNTSDKAVDYLIKHTRHISWVHFRQNPHPKAVEYVLKFPGQQGMAYHNPHPLVVSIGNFS